MTSVLADSVVLLHMCFVVFVVAGGLLALRWRRMAWVHVPCAVWGAWIEFAGWICPLTPLEIWLRRRAGEAGFETGFIEHYVLPVLYPSELTRSTQLVLGTVVVVLNVVLYAWVWRRWGRALVRWS